MVMESPNLYVALLLGGCTLGGCVTEWSPDVSGGQLLLHVLVSCVYGLRLYNANHRPNASLRNHAVLAMMYAATNLINVSVWRAGISYSHQLVIRSCSALTNLLVGVLVFGKAKDYTMRHYLQALSVSVGMYMVTVGNMNPGDFARVFPGVLLLGGSMLISSAMGHVQHATMKLAGRDERMFYSHLLSLPILLISTGTSTMFSIHSAMFAISQYVCIYGVYGVLDNGGTHTLTLALILRKLISIIIADLWHVRFSGFLHWGGAGIVLVTCLSSLRLHESKRA